MPLQIVPKNKQMKAMFSKYINTHRNDPMSDPIKEMRPSIATAPASVKLGRGRSIDQRPFVQTEF